jgi:hypothetical protein
MNIGGRSQFACKATNQGGSHVATANETDF